MFRVSSFLSFVGLFLLMTAEQNAGLPKRKKGQEGGLSKQERIHIREVIKIALEEFKDEDILKVLKESLELRLKICFAPFPPLRPASKKVSYSNGVKEDEEFTPEQRKGLRELLLECLEHFDEQEILDFLTHSIEFRVKFCPPPHYLLPPGPYPSTFPGPESEPSITPRSPTKPLGITPRSPTKTPLLNSKANPKTRATTTSSGQTSASPITTEAATQSALVKERRLIENAVFEDDMADLAEDVTFEDAALSKIQSDEPVLNQKGIKDDAKAKVVKEASNKRASSPGNSRFVGIGEKDSTKKLAQRMKKLLSTQQLKLSKADLAPEKEIAGSPEDEAQSDIEKPEVVGRAIEELVEPAKRLAKKSSSPESKLTLSNLVSDKKSVLNAPVDPGESESKQPNDRSIVGSSEKVGKTSLSTNSDEGEFSSIMTIDYSEATHEADAGVVGVNLGLIAESNDELS